MITRRGIAVGLLASVPVALTPGLALSKEDKFAAWNRKIERVADKIQDILGYHIGKVCNEGLRKAIVADFQREFGVTPKVIFPGRADGQDGVVQVEASIDGEFYIGSITAAMMIEATHERI